MEPMISFIEGPLLVAVLAVFAIGVACRGVFLIYALFRRGMEPSAKRDKAGLNFGRFFLPFHMGILKKPVYGIVRYVFHLCLIIVPIWFSGHIILWEGSVMGWSWSALPDVWADRMTMLVLSLAAFFFLRRVAVSDIRKNSSVSDYVLILIAGIPFLSGYFMTHGTLEAFLGEHIRTIHVLSAQLLLVVAVFLFVRASLNVERCTGCAACEVECPTGTLSYQDEGAERRFFYNHYQCIRCGACVKVCPEDAAELKHEMSLKKFFDINRREKIRTVALKPCEGCGALIAPDPQLAKIREMVGNDFVRLCNQCKIRVTAEVYRGVSEANLFPKHNSS